jgi:stress response protein YsnF
MKKPIAAEQARSPEPAAVPGPEMPAHSPAPEAEEVIPLVEETVRIDKRQAVTGRVRVRTIVDTVEEFARASLQSDTVEVTRVPVDQVVDTPPAIRTEGDVTIVPVFEEILVVEKRLLVKEELHIRRKTSTEEVEVPVSVRKQRAVIERIDPKGQTTEE